MIPFDQSIGGQRIPSVGQATGLPDLYFAESLLAKELR
jgi:hypothetical protein